MKTRITALTLVLALLLIAPLNIASAKNSDEGLSIPVTGTFTDQAGGIGKYAGTLNIQRFAVVSNRIHAVGTVSGTLTDSLGNVVATGLQTVSLPITLAGGQGGTQGSADRTSPAERKVTFTKASYTPPAAPAQALSCQILRLSIGAINLDLLGLTVSLNPVLLVISAVPGAGNLLGNLLCAIVNLLNGVGSLIQIVNLLNQLLALLGSL